MPIPTPFHARTSELCTSLFWKDWAGHYAVRSFDTRHDREYYAIRQAAALIDVSPLHKYRVTGADAGAFLARVMVRDIRKLRAGRVTYACWCDDDGKVIDDGTVSRIADQDFRVTSNVPALAWLERHARGADVLIDDVSEDLGALALQGPTSRAILLNLGDPALGSLRYFGVTRASIDGIPVEVSRTGYTGDLGYEVWVSRQDAVRVWDAIMAAGRPQRIVPTGLDAMDVARIEAGFVLNGVDYFSAHHCLIDSRKSSPFEIGLGWMVKLDRDPFVGQAALQLERRRGSAWSMVGLVIDWDAYEALFAHFGLPPQVCTQAWRDPVPVYDRRGRQVGYATSGAWSPILKQNLALATVRRNHAVAGTRLRLEVTAEFERHPLPATVVETPFFNPERKRA